MIVAAISAKDCLQCGGEFTKTCFESRKAWLTRHKYCSRKCSHESKKAKILSPSHIEAIRAAHLGRKKSPEQRAKQKGEGAPHWKGGLPRCPDCGNRVANRYAKYCRSCRVSKHNTGTDGGNWKGGVHAVSSCVRGLLKYREWRTSVFTRDGFCCVECGASGYMEADHIVPFSALMKMGDITCVDEALKFEPLWDVANGRTLCKPCHEETPTYKALALKFVVTQIAA